MAQASRATIAAPVALLAVLVAAVGAPAEVGAATQGTRAVDYATLARKGLADARRHWWNGRVGWYRDHLDGDRNDVATVWNVVHVFEAVNGLAIAHPSSSGRRSVRRMALAMERYWSRRVRPHGAYTAALAGRHGNGANYAFFDDNGWLGLAFADAYRATHNARFLRDAARALRFIDERGWDPKRGVRYATWDKRTSLASLASATALAADLYRFTGRTSYRRIARRYLAWADRHALKRRSGLYEMRDHPAVTYVEGAMLGAHLALCRKHMRDSCKRAERLAEAAERRWGRDQRYQAPQFDAILFRYLIRLADQDGSARWYDWARAAAADAWRNGREHGLFLKVWDGSAITSHGGGMGQFTYGRLCTHAAAASLFAWLAALPAPGSRAGKRAG